VRVTRNATGNIKRLNAAVVLNHRTTTDAKGKSNTQPISQEELDKLTALVRETIGMDDKRGDSIKLVSAPFQQVKEEVDDTPMWKRPETIDLVRTLAVPAALTLAAVIVVFGAIRPAIQAAKPLPAPEPVQPETAVLSAVVDDDEELPSPDGTTLALAGPATDQRLERAIQLSKDNPLAVANVLRGWMNN
jgi:flagellar M-ring protein FliF